MIITVGWVLIDCESILSTECNTCIYAIRISTTHVQLLTLGAHAQRGLQYSVCLCVRACVCACVSESVTSLTATPLTHRYKIRYESNANALLKVFDSWISLKIFCSKVTALFAHLNEL